MPAKVYLELVFEKDAEILVLTIEHVCIPSYILIIKISSSNYKPSQEICRIATKKNAKGFVKTIFVGKIIFEGES